ncbi:MAG: transketolase C-terminal domain-containing protein [Candidatus Atabeyarchaeum deiterrae]
MVLKMIEGSRAVAEFVRLCRPNVISAYPITPQTHIVENLAQIVADGDLKAEFVNVESEHSAASVVLGASATGARTYTATTSQGLLLMLEVLYNIAGLRLPVSLTCANRSVSSPINIWNDQQDSMTARDSGWIQIYAENNQEASDLQIQAYKIGEDKDIMLPVMVCMDGFILTHAYEPVDVPAEDDVDDFLPPYQPLYYLTTKNPLTFGAMVGPERYMETRYLMQETMEKAKGRIEHVANDFEAKFGRHYGGLIDKYQVSDAETLLVGMGSMVGTMKDVVDKMRRQGKKIGVVKVRTFRPFPNEKLHDALKGVKNLIIFEKAISLGKGGILCAEIKSLFDAKSKNSPSNISNFIIGLGGRDITQNSIQGAIERAEKQPAELDFVDLDRELLGEGD